jgi:putative nucleotidyltransferase with HDIG domain
LWVTLYVRTNEGGILAVAAFRSRNRTIPLWLKALVFTFGYVAAAEIGSLLSVQRTFATFWPPAGLFIAILLISERRDWPVLVLAGLAGNLCFDLLHGRALFATVGFAIANASEALTGATLVRMLIGTRPKLASLRESFVFSAVGAVMAPVVGATIGTLVVLATSPGASWWTTWYTWLIGDMLGIVLIGSVVLTGVAQWDAYRDDPRLEGPSALRRLGISMLIAVPFGVVSHAVFGPVGGGTPWKFIVTPGLVSCGLAGGPLGAAVGLVVIAIGGVAAMSAGAPVSGLVGLTSATHLFQAQAFFVVGGITILSLAGVIAENRHFASEARDSAERFRVLFDTMREGVAYCRMIFDEDGAPVDWVYLQVNEAFSELTGLVDVVGRHVWEVLPGLDEQNPELYETYGRTASTGEPALFESGVASIGRILRISVTSPATGEFVAVFEDVTDRVAGEKALEASNTRLEKMVYDVAQAMGSVVEARDPYTQGHEVRVASLARRIAAEMHLSDEEQDEVNMAGLLHDIGKLRVPAEILTKPGRLSAPEFSLIKEHPEGSYDILKLIDFPWPVADIVRQHHERLDGSGYPAGLRGDEIMIQARILAVADVVEAMASYRPYRPALGLEAAIEEVAAHPEQYEATVVRACIRLYERNETGL